MQHAGLLGHCFSLLALDVEGKHRNDLTFIFYEGGERKNQQRFCDDASEEKCKTWLNRVLN